MNKRIYKNIKGYYDNFSRDYDLQREKGYFSFINHLEASIIKEFCPSKGMILEIGCGTGLIMNEIKKQISSDRIIGIDISEAMLAWAAKKKFRVLRANAVKLPFKDNSFDFVYSFKVLAHIPEIKQVIKEIGRVAKENSILVLEFYNPWSIKFILNRISHLFNRKKVYSRYDSLKKIEAYLLSGMEIIAIKGIRVFTLSGLIFKIPLINNFFYVLERKISSTIIGKLFGGYLVVVVKNKKGRC